jgi:hypothetical protein
MRKVDTTLFTKKIRNDLFVLQIYVDDIILLVLFEELMPSHFTCSIGANIFIYLYHRHN